jgi:hypothetical protein
MFSNPFGLYQLVTVDSKPLGSEVILTIRRADVDHNGYYHREWRNALLNSRSTQQTRLVRASLSEPTEYIIVIFSLS